MTESERTVITESPPSGGASDSGAAAQPTPQPAAAAPEAPQDPYSRALAALSAGLTDTAEPHESAAGAEETPAEPAPEPAPVSDGAESPDKPPAEPAEAKPAAEPTGKARQWAEVARERQKVRQRAQELDARQKELDASLAKIERLKTDPLGALQDLGLSYRDLTERAIKGEGKAPTPDANEGVESLRKELQALRDAQQQAEQERQVREYQGTIRSLLSESGDRHALLRAETPDWAAEVFDYQMRHHAQTGELLEPDTAADHLEAYLVERVKRYGSVAKVKTLWGEVDPHSEEPSEVPITPAPNGSTGKRNGATASLSNRDATEISRRARQGETDEDCRKRALAVLSQIPKD